MENIRYSTVWEDADVVCSALGLAVEGQRVLSIASAGDNVLAILTLNPQEVVAVDFSSAQLACLEFRIAAFRVLKFSEILDVLGATPTADRMSLYARIRPSMSQEAQKFWDDRPGAVSAGIIHSGRMERYLAAFRRFVLPIAQSKEAREGLLFDRVTGEREMYYDRVWNNSTWRLLFRLFFDSRVMKRAGRDRRFFSQTSVSVAPILLERARRVLTSTPPGQNPYLTLALTGRYSATAYPLYLRPENIDTIKSRVDRVTTMRTNACSLPSSSKPFAGLYLSNIFEYMGVSEFERCYSRLLDFGSSGGRLVYWNLFAERSAPHNLLSRVVPRSDVTSRLEQLNKIPTYSSLRIEDIR